MSLFINCNNSILNLDCKKTWLMAITTSLQLTCCWHYWWINVCVHEMHVCVLHAYSLKHYLLMFVVGFWWCNLWDRQPRRGVLHGQHTDHVASTWQLDPMDFRHQCESLLSHVIACDVWLSLPIISSIGCHLTLVLSFIVRMMVGTRSRELLPWNNP